MTGERRLRIAPLSAITALKNKAYIEMKKKIFLFMLIIIYCIIFL